MNPIIIIPARIASQRLPNKALASISGVPMVVRVMRQAKAANIGPVIVACCGIEIADIVEAHGGVAVITDPALPTGTDRVVAALNRVDPEHKHDIVINLQGDLPTIDPKDIGQVLVPFQHPDVAITSLAALIKDPKEIKNPNVVKIATSIWTKQGKTDVARAVYFSRQRIPANATSFYHHIGIYGYRRQALERFVTLPVSYLEETERLEQLRALEDGMRIDVALVNNIPPSVDTAEDLALVRALVNK